MFFFGWVECVTCNCGDKGSWIRIALWCLIMLPFWQFDYLKSLEIEEKINKIRWCQTANGARLLLSTNDKTIKLWKVLSFKAQGCPFLCFQLSNYCSTFAYEVKGSFSQLEFTICYALLALFSIFIFHGVWKIELRS